MTMSFILRAAIFCTLIISGLANAGLNDDPVVFKSGEWSVLRSIDAMSDEVSCTGVYKGNNGIQLSDDIMFVQVRGGLKSITLRFDNQPAEDLRLPSSLEKQMSSIMIENNAFTKVLGSNRLRVQVYTVLGEIKKYDINLKGTTKVVENIRSGCPGTAVSKTLPKKPSLCSEKVLKRLRTKKVSADVIKYACSPG